MSADIRSFSVARADRENDNSLISPVECLEEVAREIRFGERACQKVLVLTLDVGEDGNRFNHGFRVSNMRCSEIVALLEAAKVSVLQSMSIIPE